MDSLAHWQSKAYLLTHPRNLRQKLALQIGRVIYRTRTFIGRVGLPSTTYLHLAADFTSKQKIPGDYCEFGVFMGRSFVSAWNLMRNEKRRFFAFDSFEGLPPTDAPADNFYRQFGVGTFKATEQEFLERLMRHKVDLSRVTTVPGWFDKLSDETAKRIGLENIAVAYIDADLYFSTVPVLDFITRYLSDGAIIVFDDWYLFKAHPDLGVRRAFYEWAEKNPTFKFTELHLPHSWQAAFIFHKPLAE